MRQFYTVLFYSSVINVRSLLVALHSEMKDVLRSFQNMENNFEVVQCISLNKLISLDLLYYENIEQVVIIE